MKILILKPSSLGDVVQALPVLRLLKLQDSKREIYWWLSSELLSLLEEDPDLSGLIPFDRKAWATPRGWRQHFLSVRQMRAHRFDWVIDLQGLARSGIFAWLARGDFTIGLDDPREGAPAFYDVRVPRRSFHSHAVEWYLDVLRVLQVPVHWDFTWLPRREPAASEIQRKWHVGDARWLILIPGARWPTKRWPLESYQELVKLITTHHAEINVAILGAHAETALAKSIAQMRPQRCLDLTGRTTLPEMIEWLRLSQLIVGNDTGPMHVAAALRKPVVALFGPTEPRRTGPYGRIEQTIRIRLPCAPCFKPSCTNPKTLQCLREITPWDVFEQVQRRLQNENEPVPCPRDAAAA